VWTGPAGARKKLCSIGIACRRWVTFHGLALNVTTDLAYFHRINPCGFDADVMTSMAAQLEGEIASPGSAGARSNADALRSTIDIEAVRGVLASELGATLGRG